MSEDYSLCWSHKRHQFHIDPLRVLLQRNRQAYSADVELNDYHLIFIGSRQECEQAAHAARGTLQARGIAAQAIKRAQGR